MLLTVSLPAIIPEAVQLMMSDMYVSQSGIINNRMPSSSIASPHNTHLKNALLSMAEPNSSRDNTDATPGKIDHCDVWLQHLRV